MKKFLLPSFIAFQLVNAQELSPPNFSRESGFYDEEFYLNLSHEDQEAQIIYTVDGSEPDINNLNGKVFKYKKQYPEFSGQLPYEFFEGKINTSIYDSDLLIFDRTNEENFISQIATTYSSTPYFPENNVTKNFVIKAKAILNEKESDVVTKVYFINNHQNFNYTLPIFSIGVDADQLYGYEDGLWVAGQVFDKWRLDNPDLTAGPWTDANYQQSGSSTERKIQLNVFYNKEEVINQNSGIRNHGNASRYLPNRSVRLYAKSGYGKSNFDYNFFNNYDISRFKRLILRNSGSDTFMTMMLDGFLQSSVKHLNFDTQEYQPVIFFVNSEYNGIFNLRERFDEKYFEEIYDVDEDDLDFYENAGLVSNGTIDFYENLMNYLSENSFKSNDNFNELNQKIDFNNFTDYYISQIYFGNTDWPHNNNEFWRKRVDFTEDAPYGHDGRLRWVMKDLDLAYNSYEVQDNSLQEAFGLTIHNDIKHTLIINKAIENEDYKQFFINRFADLLNTSFLAQRMINQVDINKNVIEPEIEEHINRWKTISDFSTWEHHIDRLKTYATERPAYQKQHLLDYFNLDGTYQLTTNLKELNQGFVKVNTIEINNTTVGIDENYQTWSGEYFQGIPVKLQAIALPGYKFSHWEGDYNSTEQELTINPTNNTNIVAVFEKTLGVGDVDKVDFMVAPNPTTDFVKIITQKEIHHYKIYTQTGVLVKQGKLENKTIDFQELPNGIYLLTLDVNNQKITKKIIKK